MDFDTGNDLETKAGVPSHDALVTHRELMRIFDAYKETNDERLAEIERGRADPLFEQKLERVNADLNRKIDALTLKNARPALGREGSMARSSGAIEHKTAFDAYVRHGESAGLRALETKALSVGSNPDGGYLVPDEIERAIGARLTAISPIRSIAGVREISANVYKKPFMTTGPAVGWVGETAARPQTDSPVLDRAVVSGDGALRHAGGDRDAARGLRRQHRRVARGRSGAGLRRAGGRGLRHRRRRQQAEGLSRLHHGRQRLLDVGQHRLHRDRARPARSRRPIRPTCWSIWSMRVQGRLPAERRRS